MTSLTVKAVEAIEDASTRDAGRAKNLFALGVLSWLYGRPADVTHRWIEEKFARKPAVMQANLAAFNAGWSFGETTELLDVQYKVKPATRRCARHVSQRQRDDRAVARPDRGQRSQPAAARAGELPDHAGLGAAP